MPKKLPLKASRFYGNFFISTVVLIMIYEYVALMLSKLYYAQNASIVMLIISHLQFSMILWCFIQTVFTDPGEVPTFWGFRKGDPISRRKRYCLIWNVFKPDRCHHWSHWNRWVLNMDHHWPWINNWIGFWNRKYFILLLFYVFIGIYTYTIYQGIEAFDVLYIIYLKFNYGKQEVVIGRTIIVIASMILAFLIWFLVSTFFKFHMMLLFDNKTTIEWIANQHKPFKSVYDISLRHNVTQVFGK